MAKSKSEPAKSKKKILQAQIAITLQETFADLEKTVGEKKFKQHIKKASKVLAAGAVIKDTPPIKKSAAPKAAGKKSVVKKSAVKKAAPKKKAS